jgi:hypothetical protein
VKSKSRCRGSSETLIDEVGDDDRQWLGSDGRFDFHAGSRQSSQGRLRDGARDHSALLRGSPFLGMKTVVPLMEQSGGGSIANISRHRYRGARDDGLGGPHCTVDQHPHYGEDIVGARREFRDEAVYLKLTY